MTDLVGSFGNLTKSAAEFSWAVAVFGLSQGAKVLNGLPTSDPAKTATASFEAATATLKEQLGDTADTTFEVGNGLQQAAIGVGLNLLKPENYSPRTVVETGANLARWGLGIAAQLVPGGKVGSGGPPTGWGPVNREDAEIFRR